MTNFEQVCEFINTRDMTDNHKAQAIRELHFIRMWDRTWTAGVLITSFTWRVSYYGWAYWNNIYQAQEQKEN